MKKYSLFIFTLLSTVSVFGQEVIGSAGGTLSSGPLIVSQTIGETVIGTLTNEISITQGFHQSSGIITSIDEIVKAQDVTVYPNPFSQQIFVSGEEELGKINVYDSKGMLVFQHQTQKGETIAELELSHLSAGHYIIRSWVINRAKSTSHSIIKQ